MWQHKNINAAIADEMISADMNMENMENHFCQNGDTSHNKQD